MNTPTTAVSISLDDLLSESLGIAKDVAEIKVARKAISAGLATKEQAGELKARVRVYEMKTEWIAVAEVMLFDVQTCRNCGAHHHHFQGFFQHQHHRNHEIGRWVPSSSSPQGTESLRKEVEQNFVEVEACSNCCDTFGHHFSTETETETEPKGEGNV
jgi:hypothetical protein